MYVQKDKTNLNGKKSNIKRAGIHPGGLARFSSDSQRESRHRFDETISNGRLILRCEGYILWFFWKLLPTK